MKWHDWFLEGILSVGCWRRFKDRWSLMICDDQWWMQEVYFASGAVTIRVSYFWCILLFRHWFWFWISMSCIQEGWWMPSQDRLYNSSWWQSTTRRLQRQPLILKPREWEIRRYRESQSSKIDLADSEFKCRFYLCVEFLGTILTTWEVLPGVVSTLCFFHTTPQTKYLYII